MPLDARISVTLPAHPKTQKLIRRQGAATAWNLICLFLWAAANRSDGNLAGMDVEDIEIAAGWSGEPGVFVTALIDVGFIDWKDGAHSIHDWQEHNPWAAGAKGRSEASAWAALCKRHGRAEAARLMPEYAARMRPAHDAHAPGTNPHSDESAPGMRPAENGSAPLPSPSPSPTPTGTDGARAPRTATKGTRLALDWRPSEEARAYARNLGLDDGEIQAEADEFRDYFTGKDAAKPVKRDWTAAWQRWVRGNAQKRIARRSRGPSARGASVAAARDSILAKAGIRRGTADELQPVQGGWARGNSAGQIGSGTVIDADRWREVPGSADRVEAADEAVSGFDGGHGGAAGGVPEAGEGLPGGRGALRPDDAAEHEPLVACMAGASGAAGDDDLPAPAHAESAPLDYEPDIGPMPGFLRRMA